MIMEQKEANKLLTHIFKVCQMVETNLGTPKSDRIDPTEDNLRYWHAAAHHMYLLYVVLINLQRRGYAHDEVVAKLNDKISHCDLLIAQHLYMVVAQLPLERLNFEVIQVDENDSSAFLGRIQESDIEMVVSAEGVKGRGITKETLEDMLLANSLRQLQVFESDGGTKSSEVQDVVVSALARMTGAPNVFEIVREAAQDDLINRVRAGEVDAQVLLVEGEFTTESMHEVPLDQLYFAKRLVEAKFEMDSVNATEAKIYEMTMAELDRRDAEAR